MVECLFCRHALAQVSQLFFCPKCQAYFSNHGSELKYKQVRYSVFPNSSVNNTEIVLSNSHNFQEDSNFIFSSDNTLHTYMIQLCEQCEKREIKDLVVKNFTDFFLKLNICTDCKNRNINALKDEYYWNLDKKCTHIPLEKRYFIAHFLVITLCFLWNKSVFLLLLSFFLIKNFVQLFETLLLFIIWSMFDTYTLFYLIIYFFQLRYLRSLKFTRFVIKPDMKQLNEHFSQLKL